MCRKLQYTPVVKRMEQSRSYVGRATFVLIALAAAGASARNFAVTSTIDPPSADPGGTVNLEVTFTVAPGIHLYKDKISFDWERTDGVTPGQPVFPPAATIPDPLSDGGFAVIEVYENSVTVTVPVTISAEPGKTATIEGVVNYQGCTNTMCFMPMHYSLVHAIPVPAGEVPSGSDQGFLVRILMAFGVGILMSLTPCVYPLIPITAAIIAGRQPAGEASALTALVRSVVYVLGLAIVYAALGVASASLGGAFARWLKTAWVLVPVACIFVVLALSMFELFTIQTPGFVTNRIVGRRSGKNLGDVFVLGLVAGVVATPCIAAPLAGMLTFIATTGNRMLGFWMLFSLAWGMGLVLIVAGTLTSSLLPKAGEWTVWVKKLFGFVMLWAAAYFVTPVVGIAAYKIISAAVIVAAVVFLGGLDTLSASSGFADRFKRTVGTIATVFAIVLFVDGAVDLKGGGNPAPGELPQTDTGPLELADSAALDRARLSGRPTMVEFSAKWCTLCKAVEKRVLSSEPVTSRLDRVNALKIDVDRSPEVQDKYGILGVPMLVFFDARGHERSDLRLGGVPGPDEVAAAIDMLLPMAEE